MDLGAFIRDKRRAKGLTQQQLADLAGVGLNFVYQLEKNKPTVQLDCTRLVLNALGFDLGVEPALKAWPITMPKTRTLPWD
jgi:y4mF family transcriptional regulator